MTWGGIMRLVLRSTLAAATTAAMIFGGTAVAAASTGSLGSASIDSYVSAEQMPPLTKEQVSFIEESLGQAGPNRAQPLNMPMNLNTGSFQPQDAAVPVVVIGAAAWCASGALSSIPTSILDDISNGGAGVPYARNAIIGCITGNLGGFAWRVLPGWAKDKAIAAVAAFIIRYIR
jgi:hypothetical protein